jgi:RNA methyltransferase, TrmH family
MDGNESQLFEQPPKDGGLDDSSSPEEAEGSPKTNPDQSEEDAIGQARVVRNHNETAGRQPFIVSIVGRPSLFDFPTRHGGCHGTNECSHDGIETGFAPLAHRHDLIGHPGQTEGVNPGSNQFTILDGFHAWKHATRFGATIDRCISDDLEGLQGLTASLAPDLGIAALERVEVVTPEVMRSLVLAWGLRAVHHTRVAAIAHRPIGAGLIRGREARQGRPVVFVDHPRNPGNLGAVVRAVAAANGAGVLTSGQINPWHPDVVRAAAGTHFAIDVDHVSDIDLDTVEGPIFGLDADGADLFHADIPPGAVIAVGAERSGLSDGLRSRLDGMVSLPMRSGVSSLNLATSVSAALYLMRARAEFARIETTNR